MRSRFFRSVFCVLIVLSCTVSISTTAISNAIGDADRQLFDYIHEDMQNKFLDKIMSPIGRMGDSRNYGMLFMFLCAFGNEKMFETGKLAATAFLVGAPLGHTLRRITNRPRPLNPEDKNSFPSGHVILATNIAVICGYEYPILRIPLYTLAAGTAFSRVYLGRHYPSDVLVGAAVGVLASVLAIRYKEPILKFTF